MKNTQSYKSLLLGLLVGAAPLAGYAQQDAAPAPVADAPAVSADKMWYDFGWLVSQGAAALEMNAQEKAQFIKGISDGLEGKDGPGEDQQVQIALNQFLQERYMKVTAEKNKSFFENIKKDADIKQSPSGLYYKIIKSGSDKKATSADNVRVHYRGALVDGTVFDDSFARGEPATFPVAGVVPGFGEGVQLVGEGGEVKLYIPGELAYGENPPMGSGIPPNAVLVFDVNVEAVNPEAK